MKRVILLLLSVMLISGCSRNNVNEPKDPYASQSDSNNDAGIEPANESQEEDASVSHTAQTEEEENNLLYLWKKDITLQDPWVPTQDLSSFPYKEITIPSSEAVPVEIRLESLELDSDQIDPAQGDVRSIYDLVDMEESLKEAYPKIWSDLKKYNEFARQNAVDEIEEGETRFRAYCDENPDHPFSLTSATRIEMKRADSGIVSYFRSVYRNNLGFEPDYLEIYGRTIDAASGRVLTLNDILTDTSGLAQKIWDELVKNGSRSESDPNRDSFIELVETAIQGCRDDGSFGWALDQAGIEFVMVVSDTDGEKTVHIRERAYVPFSICSETVRKGIVQESAASLDH